MSHPTALPTANTELIWVLAAIIGLLVAAFIVNAIARFLREWMEQAPPIRIPHRQGPIIAFPNWRVRTWYRIVKHYRNKAHPDSKQEHHPPSAPSPTKPSRVHPRP